MGGFSRAFAGALLVLASFGLARAARAETRSAVEIVWRAPSSCPSQRELEAQIASTIGSRATRRTPMRAQADVWASEGGGWKADLELSSEGQVTKRQVSGDTCKSVTSAVAIVIGVAAIDDHVPVPEAPAWPPPADAVPAAPAASVEAPAAAVAPAAPLAPPQTPTPSKVAEPAPPEDASARSSPRRLHLPPFEVGASALMDKGSLPALAPGIEVYAGIRPSIWRLEVVGAYLAKEAGSLSAVAADGATLSQVDVGPRVCTAWGVGRLEAGPCVTARAGWVFASGVGAGPKTGTGNVLTAAVGGRGALRLTRWANVHLEADLLAPVDRPNFYFTAITPGTVFRPSAVTFRGFLGVDLQL